MRHHSSTSSSEAPEQVGTVPWALIGAVAILVAVELIVRSIEPRRLIPYERTGRVSYAAMRHYTAAYGPPEIAIIGSSRGREAFAMPRMRERLEAALGRPVRVGNYASAAASAATCEGIVRLLLRREEKPELIVYAVTFMQLSRVAQTNTHASELCYLDDWWQLEDVRTARRTRLLPDVLRNEIDLRYLTFAYREKATMWIRAHAGPLEGSARFVEPPCPIDGGLTAQQVFKPDVSLATRPIKDRRVQRYLAGRMVKDRYPMSAAQGDTVRRMIRASREAGVRFVIVEVPVPELMRRNLPEGTYEEFLGRFTRIAAQEDVEFLTIADLGVAFTEDHFREQSHMNLPGALRLTDAVTEQVVEPLLRGRDVRPPATSEVASAGE